MADNAQVILQASTLPEGSCYASEQERLNAYVAAISGELPGNFTVVNSGSDTPSVNDRDKPWIRSNPDGSPDGTYYFFNGAWRRPAPLPGPGFIGIWLGAAADVDTLDGGTAGVATVNTGPFWEIVTAFAARSPMGVGTLPSGTAVAVNGSVGEEKHTLVTAELPDVLGSNRSPVQGFLVKTTGVGGAAIGGNGPWQNMDFEEIAKGGTPTPLNVVHPVLGCYFIRRTVRIYLSV